MSAWNVDRRPERFSRHWYNVASLDKTTYVASALADRASRDAWAEHKTMFFRERDGPGDVIDYNAAVGVSGCGFMGFGFARFPAAAP